MHETRSRTPVQQKAQMRAVRLRRADGLDSLVLGEESIPAPGPGELLVRIRACALNFHDALVVSGTIPSGEGRTPLSDGAGEIVAVGSGVEGFATGDLVASTFYPHWIAGEMTAGGGRDIPGEVVDGYARDYAVMPAHAFTRAPAGYSATEAATLGCAGVTAWRALVTVGRVRPGDVVLVQGTGGVSLFALQFARAAGARVIATSSSDEKLERLTGLGADAVINYRKQPDWGALAVELTGGRGVDHVVEVGGSSTLAQSIAACRTGGHIALVGLLTGVTAEVSIPALFSKQIRVSGISIGSRTDQEDMIRAIEVNGIKPVIDRSFPLEQIAEAFRHYGSGAHFGKVCLTL